MSGQPAVNCDVKAFGQGNNEGCPIDAPAALNSYGTPFNSVGGGVFAFLWDSTGTASTGKMAAWFFDRRNIPSDLKGGAIGMPNPKSWRSEERWAADLPHDPRASHHRAGHKTSWQS